MKKKLPSRTLVLGGANSGKSRWAEQHVAQYGRQKHYIATAQAFDTEMQDKIERHKVQRGLDWITHEAPLDVAAALALIPATDVVLLDCVTLWLSNHLLADHDLASTSSNLIAAITECPAPFIIVSNEVGQGVVPESKLGRTFRAAQGQLNQAIAEICDPVVLVMAGLPMALKGQLA